MQRYLGVISPLIGIFFSVLLSGIESLTCQYCIHSWDPTNCTSTANDKPETCASNVQTCVIATGVRRPNLQNPNKRIPVMTRQCTYPQQSAWDLDLWRAAEARGHKMICYTRMVPSVGTVFADRQCVCGGDNCNKQVWDEVMVQPLLEAGPDSKSVTGIPVIPTLGENAKEKIISATYPTTNVAEEDKKDAILDGSSTPSTSVSTENVKPADSGGLSTGVLAGIAAGGLLVLGLIGFGVSWIKFRRREGSGGEGTELSDGLSGTSADTKASEEEEVFAGSRE